MGKKICKYFAQTGFCKFRNCRYEHVGQKHAPVFDKSRGQPGGSNEEHNSEAASFGRWRAKLSGGPVGHYGRASGVQLGPFFKEARRLMTTDEGTRQNVIHCLASEDGLKLIQKLIQREFSSISETEKTRIFHVEIQSFLEIISSPEIHESLILEQDVGTIYNCIYGVGGRRAHPFLEFLADAVAIEKEGDTKAASVHLEMSLFVFSQVIELNSVAFVQDNLKVLAQRFTDIITALYAVDSLSPIQQSLQYLKRLQRRLDVGLSLPALVEQRKKIISDKPSTAFVVRKDPPGGRHDNDFADISKINIMPTFDEINSPRAEYLPVKDPRQWHVNGIAGLLDRNFRLLREDTIGQLRDSIHAELHPSSSRDIRKNQTRTYVYRHINVQSIDLHRSSGMQFLVSFAQLVSLKGSDKKRREEWWNLSKRLQPSALVCLVDPRGFALFCTVATPDRRHEKEDANDKQWKMSASLSQSAHYASVILELVEPSETNWQYILNCRTGNTARNNSQISLLEFPGILLPSFHPTLRALQKMQKLANVSMSEFLAPLEVDSLSLLVDVPPPAYATSPGFSFDLKCLMNDKSSLKVASSEPVDMEKLRGNSTLDEAQARALVTTLQRCIGLIQGPPGTGKSFTGVALIKVLLENKSQIASGLGPIICVCYTNHALDQLLEDLLDSNITSQVIRIGSQSKSERLEKHQLRKVRVEKTRLERTGQWELHNVLDGLEERFRKIHLNSVGSGISVKHYLRTFHPDRYSQFFDKDHDGYERASASKDDPEKTMKSWLKGGKDINSQTRGLEELRHIHIDQMTATERRNLHRYWVDDQKERTQLEAQAIFTSHLEAKASWDKIRDELDLRCLRDADVIGITTSGLARNLDMLRRLKSKVLVCEEAGEVLEAHLLTSLLPSIQHVILIGDHQQLRPQIQNYGLSRESHEGSQYALDRSLFERLVEPDDEVGIQIPFCTLETQRRMFPSISRLIRDTLYPSLEDAPSVSEYPEVMGIKKRLFWLDHRYTEGDTLNQDPMATSHWNDHEIQMTVALVNHLLRQGVYESGDIAVLTPYLGQLHRIRRKLAESYTVTLGEGDQEDLGNAGFTEEDGEKKEKGVSRSTLLQTVRAATIDNFQGEEAKVVVISLVRSNSQRRCGFLRTPNRANVLLSRAKHGMYIIGNSETSRGVDMWGKVLHILEKDGNLGTQLELTCPRHPDTPIVVEEPDHFVYHSPEGGCTLSCGKRLGCGHPCKQKCHSEMLHRVVYCLEACPRPRKNCVHPCPNPCGDPCPKNCQVTVYDSERILPCGHRMASLPCWQAQDLTLVKCPVLTEKEVPTCGHPVRVPCHTEVDNDEYRCLKACDKVLPCGHGCIKSCFQCTVRTPTGLNVDHGICTHKCKRPYTTCPHSCNANCHGEEPCSPCSLPCEVQCAHSRCPQKCSEPCAPCAVSECLSSCPHSSCSMPCSAPCDHIPCSLRCGKLLVCGHQCPSVCGETCPPANYCQTCASDEVKQTPVDFILGETYEQINLFENPCIFPQCGHFLTIESIDGQMDLRKHYKMDDQSRPISIAASSEPFSMGDIRACATCRGSLRNISRYGRLVRRALLDEATKKLIVYLNQRYVPLAQELPEALSKLQEQYSDTVAQLLFHGHSRIELKGSPSQQVALMRGLLNKRHKSRWHQVLSLREKIVAYQKQVEVDEQPYNRVRNMVEDARRRKKTSDQFRFDETVLQTKGQIQATSLLLRIDIALLGDFVSMKNHLRPGIDQCELYVDFEEHRKVCRRLFNDAKASRRILHQAESSIFLAQLYALEITNIKDISLAESLRGEANLAIDMAVTLCQEHPDQTPGLSDEIEGTRAMLRGAKFYAPVSNEERLAVLKAMAREFRGTGHWYYCENGHPFTIGECGMAMQLSRCPECGAPVGGQNHQSAHGVVHARDLEEAFRELQI